MLLIKTDAKVLRVEFLPERKDCPDVTEILVADKITAWNAYLQNHEDLRIESGKFICKMI
jgi:hypothetical protein